MAVTVPETVYDAVAYKGSVGTLKLSDEQLSFHTNDKVCVLPWKKVVRRQVTSASSKVSKPMFKLILKSGNEAIFQMEDRVSLEVLRDDLGERLKTYRRLHPEEQEEENVAVNKTNFTSCRRQSTPYRMVNAAATQQEKVPRRESNTSGKKQPPRRSSSYDTEPTKPNRMDSPVKPTKAHPQRRCSDSPPAPYCRNLSDDTIKKSNTKRHSTMY